MLLRLLRIFSAAALAGVIGLAGAHRTSATPSIPTPTTASAPTAITTTTVPTTTTTAAPAPRSFEEQALALISYPWQSRLHVSVVFTGPDRPGFFADSVRTGPHTWAAHIFVRPGETPAVAALSLAHELGHILDVETLGDAQRAEWLALRGRPDASWWTCFQCADYTVGTGDFAETFAADQVGFIDYRSRLAPVPTPTVIEQLRAFWRG